MKIGFLCSEYPPVRVGGIGRATSALARTLVDAGHEVRVIGLSHHDETEPDFEIDKGVKVWRIKVPQSYSRTGWIRARYRLYRTVSQWARSGALDVLETPDYQGLVACWPNLGIPVVARLHGSSSYFAVEMGARPDRLTFFLERAALRRADFCSSTSQYTADKTRRLFGLPGTGPRVVYNSTAFTTTPHEAVRVPGSVVFSGTLTPKKGVISLIRAWSSVVKECPNAQLQMFGKEGLTDSGGSMQEYLVAQLSPAIRHTVHFLGHVEVRRLRSALQSAKVAVFPSYSEAFALAPMEAMAEGCPTIYSSRGSGAELIDDGRDGLLVDPDDPRDIADAIVKVLRDDKLAAALGSAGRRRIEEHFSPSAMLAQHVDFYLECVRSYRTRALKSGSAPICAPEGLSK